MDVALAEPGFQVPPPLVLRVMVLAIKANDDGSELVTYEDEPALAVVAINKYRHGLK